MLLQHYLLQFFIQHTHTTVSVAMSSCFSPPNSIAALLAEAETTISEGQTALSSTSNSDSSPANSSSGSVHRALSFFRPITSLFAPDKKGVGYGGSFLDSFRRGGSGLFSFPSQQPTSSPADSNTAHLATILTRILPPISVKLREDVSGQEETILLLRDSGVRMHSLISQLLRAASSMETVRIYSTAYSAVLLYIGSLAARKELHCLLTEPLQQGEETLLSLLQPLVGSARTYRALLGGAPPTDTDTELDLDHLCLEALLLWDQLITAGIAGTQGIETRALPSQVVHSSSLPECGSSTGYTASADEVTAYERLLRPKCFQSIPLMAEVTKRTASFAFYAEASRLATSGVLPSSRERMSRIAREISELQVNLPVQYGSSIFVVCDEARCDVLKALVIGKQGPPTILFSCTKYTNLDALTGPEDTPYANGCFEFDLTLPADYPASPPLVLLITTGGGQVRFNPNLYANGKVCLSLLGTWHGPGWDKETSTILQVLVSIQSLIFVPDPYYNEPGFEALRGTVEGNEQSASYNATIREATLNEAIFKQMLYPSRFFEDVIKTHFAMKSKCILAQLQCWETFCRENWLLARSGSKSIDSYIGVSATYTQRAESMIKLLGTTSKRLAKLADSMVASKAAV